MTTSQPTPPPVPQVNYWQGPSSGASGDVLIPQLRARLVALVAALVIQATIAAIQILPDLPGRGSTGFWAKFAVLEFVAAAILSAGFGPRVGLRDVPVIGRIVLAIGFLALPVVALALGGLDAARVAHIDGTAATVASWVGTAFFATVFFGLPLIALAAPIRPAPLGAAPR